MVFIFTSYLVDIDRPPKKYNPSLLRMQIQIQQLICRQMHPSPPPLPNLTHLLPVLRALITPSIPTQTPSSQPILNPNTSSSTIPPFKLLNATSRSSCEKYSKLYLTSSRGRFKPAVKVTLQQACRKFDHCITQVDICATFHRLHNHLVLRQGSWNRKPPGRSHKIGKLSKPVCSLCALPRS